MGILADRSLFLPKPHCTGADLEPDVGPVFQPGQNKTKNILNDILGKLYFQFFRPKASSVIRGHRGNSQRILLGVTTVPIKLRWEKEEPGRMQDSEQVNSKEKQE